MSNNLIVFKQFQKNFSPIVHVKKKGSGGLVEFHGISSKQPLELLHQVVFVCGAEAAELLQQMRIHFCVIVFFFFVYKIKVLSKLRLLEDKGGLAIAFYYPVDIATRQHQQNFVNHTFNCLSFDFCIYHRTVLSKKV